MGKLLFFSVIFWLGLSGIALAHNDASTFTSAVTSPGYMTNEVYIGDPNLWDTFQRAAPEWLVALVPMLVAIMGLCRGFAEALVAISNRFDVPTAGKVGRAVSEVAWFLAKILSYIGVGMPKAIVLEKAETIAAKEVASGRTTNEPDPAASPGAA